MSSDVSSYDGEQRTKKGDRDRVVTSGRKIKCFRWKCREQCSKKEVQSNVVKTTKGHVVNEANVAFAIDLEKNGLHKHSGGDQRQMGIMGDSKQKRRKISF